MTSRERLMAVFSGEEPDRVPWAPVMDDYFTSSLGEQGLCMDVIDAHRYIGADIIFRHAHILKWWNIGNVEHRTIKKGNEEQRLTETPVGTLEARFRYSGNTSFLEKHPIEKVDDLKIMQYVVENTRFALQCESFLELEKRIGMDGIASVSTPTTPIQGMLQYSTGIEAFSYLINDHAPEMEEYMQTVHEKQMKEYSMMAGSPEAMKVFISYEDTSTTVFGPDWYNMYCRKYIDDYADILHGGNKVFITHMCGKLKGLAKDIAGGRMDGIDSVCPPTTGDLWAHEALERMPGKIIIGGLEPPALRFMDEEETKEYTGKVLSACKPYKNFILSTGDATSYGTLMCNLKAVTKVVSELGRRPAGI